MTAALTDKDRTPRLRRQYSCPNSERLGYSGIDRHRASDQNLGGRQNQVACKQFLPYDRRRRCRHHGAYASRAALLAEPVVIGTMRRSTREIQALLIAGINGQVA